MIALSLGKVDAAIISAIVAGACLGFLRHNFYPARIFMGDSGALLLGFVLATVSVSGLLKTASIVALVFPLLVLAMPILDTSFVVARRHEARRAGVRRPTRRTCTTASCDVGFSQRRAALVHVRLVRRRSPRRALTTRFVPPRPRGDWHLWPTLLGGRRSASSRSRPRSTSSTCSRS